MNGVVRAIRVNNSNQANGSRCSSRYSGSQGHSWVNSAIGFRLAVNGVMKGGSYLDGNRCDYNRSSYRLSTGKTVKYEMRGFRFVNGVYVAGCYKSGKTYYVRAGIRGNWNGRSTLGEQIGFR